MKTKKIIILTLACLAGGSILESCKAKIVEPDPDQKKDTTNVSINMAPKKVTIHGRDTGSGQCSTCKEEQIVSYNAKGNISKIVHSYFNGTKLTRNAETIYEWNNDLLVKVTKKTPGKLDEISAYSYNASGKITQFILTGLYPSVKKYYYAADGQLVNIISNHDSSYVDQGEDTLKIHVLRKHSDNSWIPSADYSYVNSGNTSTFKEKGYSTSVDKQITLTSEYTSILTFSTIPIAKAMHPWFFSPEEYPHPQWSYYPTHQSSEDTWWDITTTEDCDFVTKQDLYKRVTEVDFQCDHYRISFEY